MKKKTADICSYVRLLLCLLSFPLFLAACGGAGSGGGSSSGTTPVAIKLKIPGGEGSASNKSAFAPSPIAIAQLRINVTDLAGAALASTTLGVTPGQEVTVTLQIPAGRARLFTIEALNSEGIILFQGQASTDLTPDTPASVIVQMIAVQRPVLTLSPTSAFVLVGTTQSFTASLTGLDDNSVVWSVNDIEGGNPSIGTITQTNPATYTAPNPPPEPRVVTVKAAAKANRAIVATVTATILTPETTVFISGSAGADGADCGAQNSPCKSITRGLALAKPGQTLHVAAGTYDDSTEIFPILMRPGINLFGANRPAEKPVITSGRSIPVTIIAADNTTLSGFTLDPNDGSIDTLVQIDSGTPTISENQFADKGCQGVCRTSGTGIKVTGGTPLITGNEFVGFGYLSSDPNDAAMTLLNSAAPTLSGNNLHDNETGIAILNSATARIEGNTIIHNQIGISIQNSSNPDLGGGDKESSGGNMISCNTTVDVTIAETVQQIHAQRNRWDHLPPTIASAAGSGIDIISSKVIDAAEPGAASPRCLTEPPTVPSQLFATARSQNQIALSWVGSTDNFGEITYQIELCQGAGCTVFAQIGTTTETRFDDNGLSPATSYSYRVRAVDIDNNVSPYSNTTSATTPDQGAPTPPSTLAATPVSETQINLSWSPSADDVGVTGYRVERCQGANCTNFVEIAQPIAPSFNNTGLSPGVSYSYRARAIDAAGNLSGYSNTATAVTLDTTAPTPPGNLTAAAISETQINLSWGASTDNVGVAEYRLERCQGAACTNFSEIARPTTTTFSDTGRAASTAYRYRVRAVDAAINFSGFSNIATATTPDTTVPTPPSNLTANAAGETQINLSWNASADNVGVAGYRVERCQGVSCANFTEIAQPTAAAFNDPGRSIGTPYSYRIRAVDAAGNLSAYSNIASATTRDLTAPTPPASLTAAAVGESQINLSWNASTDNLSVAGYRVERCQGANCNNFVEIAQPIATAFSDTGRSAAISYTYRVRAVDAADNFSGYSNVTTATTPDTTSPTPPSNLTANPVSETQINLSWGASTDNVGVAGYRVERCQGVTCTNFIEIAQPAGTTFNDTGRAASTAYRYRVRAVDAAINFSGYSTIVTATTPDNTAPTPPTNLAANAAGGTQINLSWTSSTDNVAVAEYRIERCQGANCSNFAQIATSATTSFSNTGLSQTTSYSYRVRAVDAAGNFSGYSNTAAATTSDTTAPSPPANLTATAVSETQINLSWSASTDNIGVAGYRVERCQGTNCTNFAEIGQPTGTAFNDTGRSINILYRYQVRAVDGAGNFSGYSNIAAASTRDLTAPTSPTNLTGRAAGETQINLSWTASTDNIAVAGYRVERCQGALCANFTEIAQPTATAFNDTGLSVVTAYRYRVRAVDAAGNFSGYSNIVTAATIDTTAPTTPNGLSARGLNQSDIGLSWSPSTDNVGIAGYRLERCLATGANCVEIDTGAAGDPTKPSFNDTGLATATTYTYRVRAYDAAGNLSLYSQSASASTGRILFVANFDTNALDKPPDITLPGDPVGDALSLNTPAGTILVRSSVGGLDKRPVELNQTGGTGGVTLRGTVAGTPPKSGVYTARWRSVVSSREVGFAAIVLRDSGGRILASLAYRPGNLLDYNDRQPNGIGIGWQALTPQDFAISVDLTNRLTTLSISGRVILEDRFYESTAGDLASISMELGTTGTQTLGWDDIDIIATAP